MAMHSESEALAKRGICPRCWSTRIHEELVPAHGGPTGKPESKRLYCHDCQQVTWTFDLVIP